MELFFVMVTVQGSRPGWRTTTRGVVESGSTVTAVTLSDVPRTAVDAEVVIRNASATTETCWTARCVPLVAATWIR